MDTTLNLKDTVLEYVNSADERLLEMLKAMIEAYYEPLENNHKINDNKETNLSIFRESIVSYENSIDTDIFELTEEHKKILDERLKFHEQNPNAGKPWSEVKANLMKKYGSNANR